jgi:hypothetical protein
MKQTINKWLKRASIPMLLCFIVGSANADFVDSDADPLYAAGALAASIASMFSAPPPNATPTATITMQALSNTQVTQGALALTQAGRAAESAENASHAGTTSAISTASHNVEDLLNNIANNASSTAAAQPLSIQQNRGPVVLPTPKAMSALPEELQQAEPLPGAAKVAQPAVHSIAPPQSPSSNSLPPTPTS